jgi:hypothetical protein
MTSIQPSAPPEPVRLHSLSELSRIINSDMRTVRRKLQRHGIHPDAVAGNANRLTALYQINRVAQALNCVL